MIYHITPDPKHVKRMNRFWKFQALGIAIHRWLAFYKWHKTKPWRGNLRYGKWWEDELVDRP